MSNPVAVIDIGSNSIKLLVASRLPDGRIAAVLTRTIDARISAGIGRTEPHLGEEGMGAGLAAIRQLLADARAFSPGATLLVATSAVRDATNGTEFCHRVRAATGNEVRVLTGSEEAGLIGRGLLSDPALRSLQGFYVFDLGGGSLECLSFRERKREQAASLQLGCVRLTEKYVTDVSRPFGRASRYRVMQHVHDALVRGPFPFSLPPAAAAVGTGGTFATVRSIVAARDVIPFEQTDPFISLPHLRRLLSWLGRMTLEERKRVPGLPPARADIFPTALATLVVLGDVAAVPGFHHSLHNLRYGLAAEALGLSS